MLADLHRSRAQAGSCDRRGVNATAERLVRSIQSECRAQTIPSGERQIRKAVKETTEHKRFQRDHQGLHDERAEKPSAEANRDGVIERRETSGGVLNDPDWRAA